MAEILYAETTLRVAVFYGGSNELFTLSYYNYYYSSNLGIKFTEKPPYRYTGFHLFFFSLFFVLFSHYD